MKDCLFKIGDIVRLKTGKSPQIVREVLWSGKHKEFQLRGEYLSGARISNDYGMDYWRKPRSEHDFALIQQDTTAPEEAQEMTKVLYQTKEEKPRFGDLIATNSAGKAVLEMKGRDGAVEMFEFHMIEEVVPYTVAIINIGTTSGALHVQCVKGAVNKDDLLMELKSGGMFRVVDIDTKCRQPSGKQSKFVRVVTEAVNFGEDK